MPRIRLRVEEENQPTPPYRFTDPRDPAAGVRQFPVLRLTTLAGFQPPPGSGAAPFARTLPALIDTGAWISAIEKGTWGLLEDKKLLEWLPFEGRKTRTTGIGGRPTPYRLGRVWVSLHDLQPPRHLRPPGTPPEFVLPAVPVVAQMLQDTWELDYPILLGLHLGVLDGRWLTREAIPPAPARLDTDCGPRYGQHWRLQDYPPS